MMTVYFSYTEINQSAMHCAKPHNQKWHYDNYSDQSISMFITTRWTH